MVDDGWARRPEAEGPQGVNVLSRLPSFSIHHPACGVSQTKPYWGAVGARRHRKIMADADYSGNVGVRFHAARDQAIPERVSVADGPGWRAPQEVELPQLVVEPTTREELAECVCLFSLPAHLCKAFWSMLEQQATRGDGDFVSFAEEVARFLAFKLLPPPQGAAFELVLRLADGAFDSGGLWGVVNLADEPAFVAWPGLRLRLGPGEGCRVPAGLTLDVLAESEEPAVLVVVRTSA